MLLEVHKERLKFKKESLARTKDLHKATSEIEYRTGNTFGEIAQILEDATEVEKYPEDDRAPVVKNLIVSMMQLMENLENSSKPENSKVDISKLSNSRTFSKKSDSKLAKQDVIDLALTQDNEALKSQIEELDKRMGVIKKMRVKSQKGIFEIEKKLNFIEEEIPEDQQPEVEDLQKLDLNKEATLTNQK